MSGERILVVDDEEVMRDVLMTLLSKAGYNVTLAENGAEGLSVARRGSFDAVILALPFTKLRQVKALASGQGAGILTDFIGSKPGIDDTESACAATFPRCRRRWPRIRR